MTQPSADDWAAWLHTWRCSTPEMAAELAGRVAAVVEGETERLLPLAELRAVRRERDGLRRAIQGLLDECEALRTEHARLQQEGPA